MAKKLLTLTLLPFAGLATLGGAAPILANNISKQVSEQNHRRQLGGEIISQSNYLADPNGIEGENGNRIKKGLLLTPTEITIPTYHAPSTNNPNDTRPDIKKGALVISNTDFTLLNGEKQPSKGIIDLKGPSGSSVREWEAMNKAFETTTSILASQNENPQLGELDEFDVESIDFNVIFLDNQVNTISNFLTEELLNEISNAENPTDKFVELFNAYIPENPSGGTNYGDIVSNINITGKEYGSSISSYQSGYDTGSEELFNSSFKLDESLIEINQDNGEITIPAGAIKIINPLSASSYEVNGKSELIPMVIEMYGDNILGQTNQRLYEELSISTILEKDFVDGENPPLQGEWLDFGIKKTAGDLSQRTMATDGYEINQLEEFLDHIGEEFVEPTNFGYKGDFQDELQRMVVDFRVDNPNALKFMKKSLYGDNEIEHWENTFLPGDRDNTKYQENRPTGISEWENSEEIKFENVNLGTDNTIFFASETSNAVSADYQYKFDINTRDKLGAEITDFNVVSGMDSAEITLTIDDPDNSIVGNSMSIATDGGTLSTQTIPTNEEVTFTVNGLNAGNDYKLFFTAQEEIREGDEQLLTIERDFSTLSNGATLNSINFEESVTDINVDIDMTNASSITAFEYRFTNTKTNYTETIVFDGQDGNPSLPQDDEISFTIDRLDAYTVYNVEVNWSSTTDASDDEVERTSTELVQTMDISPGQGWVESPFFFMNEVDEVKNYWISIKYRGDINSLTLKGTDSNDITLEYPIDLGSEGVIINPENGTMTLSIESAFAESLQTDGVFSFEINGDSEEPLTSHQVFGGWNEGGDTGETEILSLEINPGKDSAEIVTFITGVNTSKEITVGITVDGDYQEYTVEEPVEGINTLKIDFLSPNTTYEATLRHNGKTTSPTEFKTAPIIGEEGYVSNDFNIKEVYGTRYIEAEYSGKLETVHVMQEGFGILHRVTPIYEDPAATVGAKESNKVWFELPVELINIGEGNVIRIMTNGELWSKGELGNTSIILPPEPSNGWIWGAIGGGAAALVAASSWLSSVKLRDKKDLSILDEYAKILGLELRDVEKVSFTDMEFAREIMNINPEEEVDTLAKNIKRIRRARGKITHKNEKMSTENIVERTMSWEKTAQLDGADFAKTFIATSKREAMNEEDELSGFMDHINAFDTTYEDLTIAELKAEAKSKGIKGYSSLKKNGIIELLEKYDKENNEIIEPESTTYENLTIAELKATAKEKGIKGYSPLKKNEIIELLENHVDAVEDSIIEEVNVEETVTEEDFEEWK